jgi:hypothetical protein
VHNKSSAGNLGDISPSALKELGIEPHAFKAEYVGIKHVSKFNIRVDKSTGELVIVPRQVSAGIPPQRTKVFIRD